MISRPLEELVARFCDLSLPKAEWTHEAHLRVGLWHVCQLGEAPAMQTLRQRIKSYNESVGGKNTDSEGYHESITQFYVKLIARFLCESDTDRPLPELAEKLIEDYGDRQLPLKYYTKERLYSREARLGWVEPDLVSIELRR
jgi:hypothetical protein